MKIFVKGKNMFAISLLLSLFGMPSFLHAQSNIDTIPAFSVPPADLQAEARKRSEFVQYDASYFKEIVPRLARAKMLGKKVFALEGAGHSTACSHQILYEAQWMLSSAADFKRIDGRLNDLEQSLNNPDQEMLSEKQDPADGSFGRCSTEWFFKLNAFFDALQNQPAGTQLQYKPVFLDKINSPEKLSAYINSIAVSNIPATGKDHRRELNESLANLLRLIIKQSPAGYAYHPKLKSTLLSLVLDSLRNPATGFWGEKYIHGDSTRFIDDLSITFHMISYLDGKIAGWDKVIAHTLAVKNLEYPIGWLHNGQYENHHNMDVATIFKLGWQHATPAEKQQMRKEVQAMLDWCLAQSLQPDGTIKITDDDDSEEEGTYFGVSFLCRVGYFDKANRFWTEEDFPNAEKMRKKAIANILLHKASGGAGGTYYKSALRQLGYME